MDGQLGHIETATNRVQLDPPASRLIHSVPYRAGPKARDSEKNGIDNMLSMNVVEWPQTEWALPVLLTIKKDGTL